MALPRLRFPEFINKNTWAIKPLIEIANVVGGGTPDTKERKFWEDGAIIWLTPSEVGGNKYIYNSIRKITPIGLKNSSARLLPKGAIILTSRATLGEMGILKVEATTNQGFQTIIVKEENSIEYVYYLQPIIKANCYKYAKGSTFLEVSSTSVKSFKLPISTKEEQVKIAECLSSLDDVISGVSDKIKALKDYKKGLMQQLFPVEGKTTPAYRFPEFTNDGEWNIDAFSKFIKLYRGSSPRPIKEYVTTDEDGVNWIKIGDTKNATSFVLDRIEEKITLKGSLKSRPVYKGELILANSMSFGKTYQLNVDGCIYDGWFVLREYEVFFYKPFLLQLLNSEYMQNQYKKLSAGGIVLNISSEIVYQTIVSHTGIEEQKKIANCLLSIDNLIEAESNHLDQLKAHKNGLMQQLFPNINQ